MGTLEEHADNPDIAAETVENTAKDLLGLSIDGPDARELDDLIWMEQVKGKTLVRVCIADVAAAVPQGCDMDAKALERGFTRYFATSHAAMLPRSLSGDDWSLLPGRGRRVLCVEMTLDDALDVCKVRIRRTVIRNLAQLTYVQAASIVQDQPADDPLLTKTLTQLADLALRLHQKRKLRGDLAVCDIEAGWVITEDGQLKRLASYEANVGYIIVQELMVLANRTVAEYLLGANVPTLFRNHEAHLAAPQREVLLRDVENAMARPDLFDLATVERRLHLVGARARYEPWAKGHYDLNLPAYLHFTSPLRRYADLVNHRIVSAVIRKQPPPYTVEELAAIGNHLNALVDEERNRVNERMKLRAAATDDANLRAGPERIANLPEKDVCRILERAAALPDPPEQLIEGMRRRVEKQTASLKERFFILYQCSNETGAWQQIRQECLDWLRKHPENAPSLLSMGTGLSGWPNVRVSMGVKGALFSCRAVIEVAQIKYDSDDHFAASKRAAQQQALLVLCHRLCGSEPPAVSPPPHCVVHGEPGERTVDYDWQQAEQQIDAEDYISALFKACIQMKRKKPKFRFEIVGTVNERRHLCHAIVQWQDREVQGDGEDLLKQKAKHKAAKAVLAALQAVDVDDADVPNASPDAEPLEDNLPEL